MALAEVELTEAERRPFDDTIPPPLFPIETNWFAAELHTSLGRGALRAAILMAEWIVMVAVVVVFLATRR